MKSPLYPSSARLAPTDRPLTQPAAIEFHAAQARKRLASAVNIVEEESGGSGFG